MQIPDLLLGKPRDVMRRAKRFWRDFAAGEAPELSTIDSRDGSHYIMLERNQIFAHESHFQLFAILQAGVEDVPPKTEILLRLFDVMLGTPWGTLGLLNDAIGLLNVHEGDARATALVRALARYWPTYMTLGNRFRPYLEGMSGRNLWEVSVILRSFVFFHGTPESSVVMPASLPNGDLREFMRGHPEQYQDVLASLDD